MEGERDIKIHHLSAMQAQNSAFYPIVSSQGPFMQEYTSEHHTCANITDLYPRYLFT